MEVVGWVRSGDGLAYSLRHAFFPLLCYMVLSVVLPAESLAHLHRVCIIMMIIIIIILV